MSNETDREGEGASARIQTPQQRAVERTKATAWAREILQNRKEMRTMIQNKLITRWPGTCKKCGTHVDKGSQAVYVRPDGGETAFKPFIVCMSCSETRESRDATPKLREEKYEYIPPTPAPAKEPEPEPERAAPAPTPEPTPPLPVPPFSFPQSISEALWTMLEPRLKAELESMKASWSPAPAREPQRVQRETVVIKAATPDAEPFTVSRTHPRFPTLLRLVSKRQHVYLYGPAGTGKDHASRQVAQALSLPYDSHTWCMRSSKSDLFGFIDAMGRYQASATRRIWEHGGVLYYDELDNAPADVLSALNTMLASEFCSFPDARIKRHADCIIIAAGNTPGYGPTLAFPDRRALPTATRTRFAFVEWGYDVDMELSIANAIGNAHGVDEAASSAWVEYVIALRAYCERSMPGVIPSPRASYNGARLLATFEVDTIVDMMVFQGLKPDAKQSLLTAVPLPKIVLRESEGA